LLSEKIKRKVLPYGEFLEPFTVNGTTFDFFVHLETSLVHTTFFMKDYEIRNFLYIFGKRYQKLILNDFKDLWNIFPRISKKLLKTPEDHYLSSFILLLEVEETEEAVKKAVRNSFISKSIWFGLKGSYNVGITLFLNGKIICPEEIKPHISWISETQIEKRVTGITQM
jgi:hypothetical protein